MDKPVLDDLIGVRFRNGGRTVEGGLDCWGLTMEVFRRWGIRLPDFTTDAFSHYTIDQLAGKAVTERQWEEAYTVDNSHAPLVVLMRLHPVFVNHAGVYVGDDRILHTTQATNVVMGRVSALKDTITGYYRYVEGN